METALQLATLQELETRIRAGLETFVDVGLCLLEIRDRRLYREKGYSQFEDYCREQWGWSRRHANRQIEAAKTIKVLGPMGPIPESERQTRELAPLVKADEQEAVKTWRELKEQHGENITAEIIRNAVQEKLKPNGPIEQEEMLLPEKRPDAALRMSEGIEWYTPKEYVEAARIVLGRIDVDPASCGEANKTVKAAIYYDKESNGLTKEWHGRVWLNPPYGGLSSTFTAKLIEEYEEGRTEKAILLINANSTDTKWFQPLWDYVLCFTNHRINFISPEGERSGSTHGSIFAYLGDNQDKFAEVFSRFGTIVARWFP